LISDLQRSTWAATTQDGRDAQSSLARLAQRCEAFVLDTGGENGPDSIKSKADIMKYLKDSFAYLHKAAGSVNETNQVTPIKSPFGDGNATRLGLAVGAVGHSFDHYGQMVEYLRMNGIVPPASRR
jgi:hypothetical protein